MRFMLLSHDSGGAPAVLDLSTWSSGWPTCPREPSASGSPERSSARTTPRYWCRSSAKALEGGTGLRSLYVIEGLDEMEPGALWEDAKLGFDLGVHHHGDWIRSAIVTDLDWIARATRLFAWMIPGEARVYPLAELDAAKAWVAGDES
jgi:hypothetical protein